MDHCSLRDGLFDLLDGLEGVKVLTLAHVLLVLARSPDAEEAELLVHGCVGRRLRRSAGRKVVYVSVRPAILANVNEVILIFRRMIKTENRM